MGVYATASRESVKVSRSVPGQVSKGRWVQVARQGNPLFSDAFVVIADKDLYSRTAPTSDHTLFRKYAENPELARLINSIVFGGSGPAIESARKYRERTRISVNKREQNGNNRERSVNKIL